MAEAVNRVQVKGVCRCDFQRRAVRFNRENLVALGGFSVQQLQHLMGDADIGQVDDLHAELISKRFDNLGFAQVASFANQLNSGGIDILGRRVATLGFLASEFDNV